MGLSVFHFTQLFSHLPPSLRVNPFEFLDEFFTAKTTVLWLSFREDFVILACVVLTQCQRVTDRQTDNLTVYRALHSKLC